MLLLEAASGLRGRSGFIDGASKLKKLGKTQTMTYQSDLSGSPTFLWGIYVGKIKPVHKELL
jgi:hypothetical protein